MSALDLGLFDVELTVDGAGASEGGQCIENMLQGIEARAQPPSKKQDAAAAPTPVRAAETMHCVSSTGADAAGADALGSDTSAALDSLLSFLFSEGAIDTGSTDKAAPPCLLSTLQSYASAPVHP
eukprot:Rhum_TRINITY_DN14819_c5_g1::Rhum_TRINITY_DN14819_c5_g1_i1::g.120846::m.120846